MLNIARTKIVATVGPACGSVDRLAELIRLGVDVFRLNMAHGSREQHQAMVDAINQARDQTGIDVGILVDLAGPKIRLGDLAGESLELKVGDEVRFIKAERPTESHELTCTYQPLVDELSVGDSIMLADGLIRLSVIEKADHQARCVVVDGGILRGRQGVNVPGTHLSAPAMDEDDVNNAIWATQQGVSFISLSFVRRPEEIEQLKQIIVRAASHPEGILPRVIAKIEKREALDNLEAIIAVSDGVMVARGDLGVEIEVERTPIEQKRIVALSRRLGKPVIVATQMLESMHHNRRPTRAEVSDVANAILDGADACMLSGETAIGSFPTDAVTVMNRIMLETEAAYSDPIIETAADPIDQSHDITRAIVHGAGRIARELDARAVVVVADSIDAALFKSQRRDFIPTIALSSNRQMVRSLSLSWGIIPYYTEQADPNDIEKIKAFVADRALHQWDFSPKDRILLVIDSPENLGQHDWLTVMTVGE